VPDFSGLDLQQAEELADDYGLQIAISDSVFNIESKRGTVLDQYPRKGANVKKNRRIFLIMNAINPEKVKMPDVVGVSLRQAVAILESQGLQVQSINYESDLAANLVLKQVFKGKIIAPGKEIYKGSSVKLILGKSSDQSTMVPSLKGLTLQQARKKSILSYLNVNKFHFDSTVQNWKDSLKAVVYKQAPKDSTYSTSGNSVELWLTVKRDLNGQ
ncbi:MAG TPA: PASTA domain-containing protein, partial [Bacteroidales bacterium]